MQYQPHKLIPDDFSPWPSRSVQPELAVAARFDQSRFDPNTCAFGCAVSSDGEIPPGISLERAQLTAAGFTGAVGETLLLLEAGKSATFAVGVGKQGELTAGTLRDAAAAFSRAAKKFEHLAIELTDAATTVDAEPASAAVVEGVLLARYTYAELKNEDKTPTTSRIELIGIHASVAGAERGAVLARASMLARDLASAPPSYLTATALGEFATAVGSDFGLDVKVFDKAALIELGCGGLLGVNAGSAEEPRMIQLMYKPSGPSTGHLGLVGKGIMYDSGGIALKPADIMHLAMKMDMSGAAAVLSAMTTLAELGCTNTVTGYLMCTDNMPSGSATAMGDVLTIRGGTTVEVKNTDAEGRLVMADAIVLANEDKVDAIVDIATLTGAALVSLGPLTAALYGNNERVIDLVREASALTDEGVWQMPLEHRYRDQLNSEIADISNLGGPYAGSTTAALFLNDFVGNTPWAHVDMCGPMQSDKDDSWRTKGASGFGARLLSEFALKFRP